MKIIALLLAALIPLWAQETPPQAPDPEQADLSRAVGESGTSGIDFVKALERHLEKYPKSPQRLVIEKALVKAAMESNDKLRIITYGERVLQAEPNSEELGLMDRLTHALLETDDPDSARTALGYAKRYKAALESMRSRGAEGHMTPGQWAEEVNKGKARVLVIEARATGNIGDSAEAANIARQAWDSYPGSEAAREVARWLAKTGRDEEALEYYANAFTIEDGRAGETDRGRDRFHLGELYTKLHGSERGLGDTILRAYDRMAALKKEHIAQLRATDPNAVASELTDFTIPNVDGTESVALASLKGKAVVMDFWATWCGPCRAQHPLIENVKKRFGKDQVVFLSIDSDDDHSGVPAFVKEMKWDHQVYYDAGLGAMLKISSIPTIIVLDTAGRISSRMQGFIPERFEEMLTERIVDASRRGPIRTGGTQPTMTEPTMTKPTIQKN